MAPPEVSAEVELYARESGRTGSIHYVPPPVAAWEVRLSLKPNDKRLLAWQQGLAPEPPVESVLLVANNPKPGGRPFVALDVHQMGPSGVRAFLEKGNSWSGRGELGTIEEATKKARENDQSRREKDRENALDDVRARARENRPWYAKRPFEKIARQVVGIALGQNRG